jgi:fructose/tagatose bisphosphate aldolase
MSLVNAKDMLLKATEEKYAVGAFNITNLIQMEAVVEAAVNKKAPLIIQTSVTPSKFLAPRVLAAIYKTLAESAPIPICLHLDHCTEVEYNPGKIDIAVRDAIINRVYYWIDILGCEGKA